MFCSDVKVDNRFVEFMFNDMYKEMLRQKWEEEELAVMNQFIYYANVQYDGKMEVDSVFIFLVNIFCYVCFEFYIVIYRIEVYFIFIDMFLIVLYSN